MNLKTLGVSLVKEAFFPHKPKILGLFACPDTDEFDDYSKNSVRLVLSGVSRERCLSIFISDVGCVSACGYEHQIPLEQCFVILDEGFEDVVVLQLPTYNNAWYVSILDVSFNKVLFEDRIDVNACTRAQISHKQDAHVCARAHLAELAWNNLPPFESFAFAKLDALVEKPMRDDAHARSYENSILHVDVETSARKINHLKPQRRYLASLQVIASRLSHAKDLGVSITPVVETHIAHSTGGEIGAYRAQGGTQGDVCFVQKKLGERTAILKCEIPFFEQPHNINIYNKRTGIFIARIAFPTQMAEKGLRRFLEVNKTAWDKQDAYQAWRESKKVGQCVRTSKPVECETGTNEGEHANGYTQECSHSYTENNMPTFSIITPLWNTPREYFEDLTRSLEAQTYSNFELVLVCASPENEQLCKMVAHYESANSLLGTLKVVMLKDNFGITLNTVAGVRAASGKYVCMLDHDDFLSPDALEVYARTICDDPEIDVLYSDEDLYENGEFCKPMFKCGVNRALVFSKNYCIHFLAIRKNLFQAGELNHSIYDGSQDYYGLLSALVHGAHVVHVPQILYHWRVSDTSISLNPHAKSYGESSSIAVLNNLLEREGVHARAHLSAVPCVYKLIWDEVPSLNVLVLSTHSTHVLVRQLQRFGFNAVGMLLRAFDAQSITQTIKHQGVVPDVMIIARSADMYCTDGLRQMVLRAFWSREVVGAISVDAHGWIQDLGFERARDEHLRARWQGQHVFHLGYSCTLASPLSVDALSMNFVAFNTHTFDDLKIKGSESESEFMTEGGLVVVNDVQVVAPDSSVPQFISSRKGSVCNIPELDDFNEFCARYESANMES